ncbi:hypothetical protein C8F04DRAFT_1178291 [Mycena alexandri]|uniref:Uncharacterized protein n=1 Tax=Mycena alexandri TaxID=1745969 RepID=A0AAD6T886_9AGAR|nr:hypothetical protein C8F04DRAFT_1178291 [Mycena alexandri]
MATHGLTYPPALLPAALPAHPSVPGARILSASQFAELHRRHTMAHAPDGVLFPFLHGLEGDNVAQNTFFAGSELRNSNAAFLSTHAGGAKRRPPRFRGLVWAVAEEDLLPPASPTSRAEDELYRELEDEYTEGDEYESDDEEVESELDELAVGMDVDGPSSASSPSAMGHLGAHGIDVRIAGEEPPITTLEGGDHEHETHGQDADAAKHMHPVAHRERQLPLATPEADDGFAAPPREGGGGDVVMEMRSSFVFDRYPPSLPPSASSSASPFSLLSPFYILSFHSSQRPVPRSPISSPFPVPFSGCPSASKGQGHKGAVWRRSRVGAARQKGAREWRARQDDDLRPGLPRSHFPFPSHFLSL